jgi:dTMP kinase
MLASELRLRGLDVLTTMEPGGTPLGRRLRAAFLETEETVSPLAELLLFAADRAQHVNFTLKPALDTGKIVISDRYADATSSYQGAGRGFDERTINQVIELATDGLKPDLTLFFDVPVEKAIARTNSRTDAGEQKNRMDSETAAFYERVRRAYLRIAANEPQRFIIIDGDGAIDEIKIKVSQIVTDFLNR